MRILVVCAEGCKRQYDASELAPGSRFRCACGEVLEVPRLAGFEAAVVRCSSCGGPRRGAEAACGHCGASFTLVEQDLDTVCPHCMARVGNRARFCHHCAAALAAEGVGGAVTDHPCPACGRQVLLASRQLGLDSLSVLECRQCAGMWLSRDAFKVVEQRAQASAAAAGAEAPPAATASVAPEPIQYRPCAVCGNLMNRQNYGRKSGVIIDTCSEHGVWFDHRELERILGWIRSGGLARANAMATRQLEERQRQLRTERLDTGGTLLQDPRSPADFFVDLFVSLF